MKCLRVGMDLARILHAIRAQQEQLFTETEEAARNEYGRLAGNVGYPAVILILSRSDHRTTFPDRPIQ